MKFGISFPQNEIGHDPAAIREFAQVAEGAGFDYLAASDHVTGAHPDRFADSETGFSTPPYTYTDDFHEPFTLFSHLAAVTSTITFISGILILPQRQTALVAKQAAAVSVLSGGRLELGIGVGWNHTEFEALNEDFGDRGLRCEEQITVLRKLWSEPLVTFEGKWHHLDHVGLSPLPAAPIPIWIGSGTSDRLMRRVAKYADGWMPGARLSEGSDVLEKLNRLLEEEGRDRAGFRLQSGVSGSRGGPADWVSYARKQAAIGVTHLGVSGAPDLDPMPGLEAAAKVRQVLADEFGS